MNFSPKSISALLFMVAVTKAATDTTEKNHRHKYSNSSFRGASYPKRKATAEEEGKRSDSDRKLKYSSQCCFEGLCREPGQWLSSPVTGKACFCSRNHPGTWEHCVRTDDKYEKSAPPNRDTALGRRQEFDEPDFVFDLQGAVPASINRAGTIQPVGVAQLPSLAGVGLTNVLVNLEPCGINLPHVHPRASEMIYIISGETLRTAFVEENGGRVIVNDLGQGQVTFFPEGLMHYQQNLGCERVTFIAALNSEDAGVATVTTQFFDLPDEAIEASLGEGPDLVYQLIDGLPSNPAEGREECLRKCGLLEEWSW